MQRMRKCKFAKGALLALSAVATVHGSLAAQRSVSLAQLPDVGRAVFAEMAQECRNYERGRLTAGPDFARQAEFNGDGKPDFLLSIQGLDCSTAASLLCGGSAGCAYEVIMSTSGPAYRRISLGTIQAVDIISGKGPARLRLGLHGSSCGRVGSDTCYKTIAWNGTRFAEVPVPTRR